MVLYLAVNKFQDAVYPYLDTVKDFFYLFLALGIAFVFWNRAEQYAKKGLQFVDPLLFLVMVIWGASGFFFLSPILQFLPGFFDSILDIFYQAIPDWDIPLYIWFNSWFSRGGWEFLKHRSWLFSSVIIPTVLLVISILPNILRKPLLAKKYHSHLNTLRNIAFGLFVGVSAHLCGDILLSFIPRGDIGFKIYGWNQWVSLIWFMFHIFLGIFIPFLLIWFIGTTYKKRSK